MTLRNVIAVTGGRHYDRPELVDAALSHLHSRFPIDLLVHGNCPTGADRFAANWCDFNGVPHTGRKYTAKWYVNGKLDKSAGPQRNRAMLETECPRILVAFPGGTGTGGCCKIARVDFIDTYDVPCSIQKSSLATEDAIWFGVNDANPIILASQAKAHGVETTETTRWVPFPVPDEVQFTTRMHLTREQVRELLPILHEFVETGEIG